MAISRNLFQLFNRAFKLMIDNKLRKDIDDTLVEKLLTLLKKIQWKELNVNVNVPEIIDLTVDPPDIYFVRELLNTTQVYFLVVKVLPSTADRNGNYPVLIKSFVIRLLGLIFTSYLKKFSYDIVLPLLKIRNEVITVDHHPPSIQDALLECLLCITKQNDGAVWFIDQNLMDFVFSCFNSTSYYVRKSAVNFVVAFISRLMNIKPYHFSYEELLRRDDMDYKENCLKFFISYVVDRIHFYKNPKEIVFAECCISVIKHLLVLKNIEDLTGDHLELEKNISECFMDLPEDTEFNKKLVDVFLTIHFKFVLPIEKINYVINCLIIKEDIKLAFSLTSSFISMAKSCCPNELVFFLLPLHILMNIPLTNIDNFFTVKADLVYNIMLRKMDDKSECKTLVCSSLSALQKVMPQVNCDSQEMVGREILRFVEHSNHDHHKWFYIILEDRAVHHAFTELYSSLLSEEVYIFMRADGSDLVFQNIMEFSKKPTTDCNFLSQLLLLLKNVLALHEKFKFDLKESDKCSLIQVLCRGLHDNRESVVDSALYLAGQMINNRVWKSDISNQGIHSIIWDIAVQGNHDGTIRSTALKVIIKGCLVDWCLNEMKALKGITECDIVKILFDLTYDPDFFLQREALSCLFQWIKLKWNDLQSSSKEYLFSALVSAIKSLDLEQKLISLDAWLWLLENKFTFSAISPSFEVKEFIEYLSSSGFGLSMIIALDDYDLAIQFKAAGILDKLQKMLTCRSISFDSITIHSSNVAESTKCDSSEYLAKPVTKEEKDKGIDNVIDISTTDQITNICRPGKPEAYDFKQKYFPSDNEERRCPVSSFWVCLWSENITSILQPSETTENEDGESLLNDIISAEILEYDSVEDIPDCY